MNPIALLSCMFVCLCLLSACGKKEDAAGTVSALPVKKAKPAADGGDKKAASAPAADAPPEMVTTPPPPMPALMQMNQLVTGFVAQYRRTPENLDELVKMKLIPRLPEPSPGKRFLLVKGKGHQVHVEEVSN